MLDFSALTLFAITLLVAAGAPGPSIAAMVFRVLTRGWRDIMPFVAAMWIGEAIWMTGAIVGLAALAETFQFALTVLKYFGAAYLAYLAWQMWHAPVPTESDLATPEASSKLSMFFAGLSLTLGNPKIVIFYVALLPTLIDLQDISLAGWATLCGVMLIVLAMIDISYIVLASRARRYLKSPIAIRLANRVGACAIGGAAVFIASK